MRTLCLGVEGMTCGACVFRLESALNNAMGIRSATVNLALAKVTLEVDLTRVSVEDITNVIRRTGFDVQTQSKTYDVEGMTCGACAGRVHDALMNVPGVLSTDIHLATDRAMVISIQGIVEEEELVERVKSSGYVLKAEVKDESQSDQYQSSVVKNRRRVLLASILTLPLVLQMFAQFVGWTEVHLMPAFEVILATPVQFWFGRFFYIGAYKALKSRGANMDVLVVLGTTSAYLYSWYLMVELGESAEGLLYFESSAVIITLVLLGKYLETRAKRSTFDSIRELLELRPRVARRRNADGEYDEIPTEKLRSSDFVACFPGERISADGVVVEGKAHVDEALITGESEPIAKQTGDNVVEGATNLDGHLVVRVTRVGADTTLNRIASLVEHAQAGKMNIQRLVDQISGIFVPVIIVIAALTAGTWIFVGSGWEAALLNSVAVLVIACPCALGLATPTAVITGTGVAARAGILFRDVEALEYAHRVTEVVFDKTGTLTQGKPTLVGMRPIGEGVQEEIVQYLQKAASIQAKSEHPIARAFLEKAKEHNLEVVDVEDFRISVGKGVEGRIGGELCLLGNQKLFQRHRISIEVENDQGSLVWLVVGGTPVAEFSFTDTVRDSSKEAVKLLNQDSIKSHVLSGDTETTTQALAESVGIDSYWYGQSPDSKVQKIQEIQESGTVVAMVGDGINDAPALAQARLGIAMSSGTDIAMEVASVTLMRPDPRLVASTLSVSKRTYRKVQQNLFWAFIYNVVMVPLACMGYLDPTLAGAAMAFSSVSVVGNSLLLRRWKARH